MADLIERTRLAAKILRDIGGQSAMAETVEEAAAALEAAREDAERYRWIRSNESDGSADLCVYRVEWRHKSGGGTHYELLTEEHADAAIDQARGKGGGE